MKYGENWRASSHNWFSNTEHTSQEGGPSQQSSGSQQQFQGRVGFKLPGLTATAGTGSRQPAPIRRPVPGKARLVASEEGGQSVELDEWGGWTEEDGITYHSVGGRVYEDGWQEGGPPQEPVPAAGDYTTGTYTTGRLSDEKEGYWKGRVYHYTNGERWDEETQFYHYLNGEYRDAQKCRHYYREEDGGGYWDEKLDQYFPKEEQKALYQRMQPQKIWRQTLMQSVGETPVDEEQGYYFDNPRFSQALGNQTKIAEDWVRDINKEVKEGSAPWGLRLHMNARKLKGLFEGLTNELINLWPENPCIFKLKYNLPMEYVDQIAQARFDAIREELPELNKTEAASLLTALRRYARRPIVVTQRGDIAFILSRPMMLATAINDTAIEKGGAGINLDAAAVHRIMHNPATKAPVAPSHLDAIMDPEKIAYLPVTEETKVAIIWAVAIRLYTHLRQHGRHLLTAEDEYALNEIGVKLTECQENIEKFQNAHVSSNEAHVGLLYYTGYLTVALGAVLTWLYWSYEPCESAPETRDLPKFDLSPFQLCLQTEQAPSQLILWGIGLILGAATSMFTHQSLRPVTHPTFSAYSSWIRKFSFLSAIILWLLPFAAHTFNACFDATQENLTVNNVQPGDPVLCENGKMAELTYTGFPLGITLFVTMLLLRNKAWPCSNFMRLRREHKAEQAALKKILFFNAGETNISRPLNDGRLDLTAAQQAFPGGGSNTTAGLTTPSTATPSEFRLGKAPKRPAPAPPLRPLEYTLGRP